MPGTWRCVVAALCLAAPARAGWVPWERALEKYGHHGQNMKQCNLGCTLPAVWTQETALVVVTVELSGLVLDSKAPIVEYVVTNASNLTPAHQCACRPFKVWPYMYDPWGREGSLFLKFITDHYAKLPKHVMFSHGQQRAWHQSLATSSFITLASEQLTDGESDLMMSPDKIACHNFRMYCKPSSTSRRFWAVYDALIPDFIEGMKPYAEYPICPALSFRGKPCCGEYLVSRAVIKRREHVAYKLLYAKGIEYTQTKDAASDYLAKVRSNLDKRFAGHLMEYMWPFIFARSPGQLVLDGASPLPEDLTRCSQKYVPDRNQI